MARELAGTRLELTAARGNGSPRDADAAERNRLRHAVGSRRHRWWRARALARWPRSSALAVLTGFGAGFLLAVAIIGMLPHALESPAD
jgi:hypothetical protein